jgi:hypothetical protein
MNSPPHENKFKVGDLIVNSDYRGVYQVMYVSPFTVVVQIQNEAVFQEILIPKSRFDNWSVYSPFDKLKIDDPVWVKDYAECDWLPRHYAGNRKAFDFGLTSHTTGDSASVASIRWNFWKTQTDEWRDSE